MLISKYAYKRKKLKASVSYKENGSLEINNDPLLKLNMILDNIKSLDYCYGTIIDLLHEAYLECSDKQSYLIKLLNFFIARPEKARLINSSYFINQYRGNLVFDVITISVDYALGQLDSALNVSDHYLTQEQGIFFFLINAHIHRANNNVAGELEVLNRTLQLFPNDPMSYLSKIEFLVRNGNINEANILLQHIEFYVKQYLKHEIEIIKEASLDLELAVKNKLFTRSEKFDLYDDNLTRATWIGYYERFVTQNKYQSGDGNYFDFINKKLSAFIQEANIHYVIDFGSLCAGLIEKTARDAPQTKFIGIDRQKFVAELNYQAYKYENMIFESGDILDYLPKLSKVQGNKLFFHVRTSCLLYPHLLIKIYSEAAKAGVEYVMFVEGDGLSRDKLKFYDFDTFPGLSIARKGSLINHNYKKILEYAGYQIISYERIKPHDLWQGVSELLGSSIFVIAKKIC
ncbi:hypothetical protein [Legionella pneumophila]|uniref:hypothetical protein n=1 Tax=Legionella pneumophila TaxID=446 RepID=UPI0013750381|nr:hypothetical protein [Legionella pneumophila]HAT1990290.1 hypothetical protein [Legionella pneumophila]HAT1993461.1 hypothetical protein [Legionella pneumophila]HAT2050858.1 hypothetical protein [Legionella pneumophila]HAT2059756.1 hypothetical protein [Legionella pneumophila]HAT2075153.1 hypothetical protein [Legionella pneumophila]